MRRSLTRVVVLTVLVAGCDLGETVGGNEREAIDLATSFMTALENRDAEKAWSLVYPPNRIGRFDSREPFDRLVERIDLSNVEWATTGAREHDGHYHVTLQLEPLEVGQALGVFVQIVPKGGVPDYAIMQVDIEPFGGDRGVLGG